MQNAELKQQNNIPQTPIEIALCIDENGMTTARALYEFLEMPAQNFARWAKTNIETNEFYEEDKDWWGFFIVKNGNECRDYRLTTDFAKHLSMESHSAKGKSARQYFVAVEDKVKEMAINRSQLSPELQMFLKMGEAMAKQEIEQKRQAEQISKLEENQKTIITAMTGQKEEDFTHWVNRCLSAIAESENYHYIGTRQEKHKAIRAESYERLNSKRPCRLKQRVEAEQGRAFRAGASNTKIKAINKLYIIEHDKDLKPVYESVIKEMMIAYCVSTKEKE